ncbi:MAG TPA: SAM-dependent methyltransferase, partial [Chloroflexota bacterium]
TAPGGVVVLEPFIEPSLWEQGHINARFVDQPKLKVARMNVSRTEGGLAILDFHYLVATAAGVEHFTGEHRLGLFSREQMEAAFTAAGLEVHFDPEGLMGRGLYIGQKGESN